MGTIRYIYDKIYFVKVTVILHNGKELSAIDDTTLNDIDANWIIYYNKVLNKWKGKIESFQVVQLSIHDPEVRRYIKDNNIHLPTEQQEEERPAWYNELNIPSEDHLRIVKNLQRAPGRKEFDPKKERSPSLKERMKKHER